MPIMRPLVKDGQGWHDVLGPIHIKTSQSASFELNDTIFHNGEKRVVRKYLN